MTDTPFTPEPGNVVHTGDLTAWLRGRQWLVQAGYMPKYHAVIGDPPYNLSFMSREWDKHATPQDYQAWVTEWAALLLDFVHPGAVLALFGGTRTYHRLACGLEEAGWEVFDSMAWMYGSGFPKSHRIERFVDGWQGYGTALKPAYEPIVLARAPRGGHTYAQLAQQYGTGALNVDGGRIGTAGEVISVRFANSMRSGTNNMHEGWKRPWQLDTEYYGNKIDASIDRVNQLGRWPANVALVHLDTCGATCAPGCPVAALGEMSGESVSSGGGMKDFSNSTLFLGNTSKNKTESSGLGDSGTAARFFYTAKAAAFERLLPDGSRCPHPTMKPIQLIEWLARLLLPPAAIGERRLLVPFAGVGSEMIGAGLAGWDSITGIEQSEEYADIGRARLAWWSQFASYDAAKERYDSTQRGAAIDEALEQAGQLRLFEMLPE